MLLLQKQYLEKYLESDSILKLLENSHYDIDNKFISYNWMKESKPKRFIYHYLYNDLLNKFDKRYKILDIGGCYTNITRQIIKKHDYELVEIFAHDDKEKLKILSTTYENVFWKIIDWYDYKIVEKKDIVIANDLFPNVDQRLELFLDKFLPICKEIRLSLTYYDQPRFYQVKRVNAEEMLWYLAWNNKNVKDVLNKYQERIENYNVDLFEKTNESLYANKRQIILIKIKGDCY